MGINWNTWPANGTTISTFRFFSRTCQLFSTVYSFAKLVQFSYRIGFFRKPMATRVEVDSDSSLGPSRTCTLPQTCTALKTWLKVHGLGYSGMKKDKLVA